MAWDAKARGGSYFYASARDGDRVRKIYLGRGEKAHEAARQIEARREERTARRLAFEVERDRLAVADKLLTEMAIWAELLARATLVANGFHERKGQWRRRRNVRSRHG